MFISNASPRPAVKSYEARNHQADVLPQQIIC